MQNNPTKDCNSSEAIITKIDGKHISVQVLKSEGCDTCAAAVLCEKTSSKGKQIDIIQSNANAFSVGEKVQLNVPQNKMFRALGLAFAYPLLLIVLFCCLGYYALGLSDAIIALISLIVLALYYFALYKLRHTPYFNFSLFISKCVSHTH